MGLRLREEPVLPVPGGGHADLARICENATPPNWVVVWANNVWKLVCNEPTNRHQIGYFLTSDDAIFAARAREEVPRLLTENQKLKAILGNLHGIEPSDIDGDALSVQDIPKATLWALLKGVAGNEMCRGHHWNTDTCWLKKIEELVNAERLL